MRWNLSHTYLDLPPAFFTEQGASPVPRPRMGVFNRELARDLGLGDLEPDDLPWLAGNGVPPGVRPFAQAYAGHQFGHLTLLGDGRALVLGEHLSPDGRRFDLQLKGSGPTPYSRGGDGRAALGPMLREYLMGEALHALGIPTTRALAVVETGGTVLRESPLPGAVLTRVASSHLRVGTFVYAAALGDPTVLESLITYTLARHFPESARESRPAAALLRGVVEAQARLVALWMATGFVHGVMNTDNMALSGEALDFGPCAFLDTYRAGQVFSSIDRQGRYAYGNQPGIAQWNLARFAETLLPALDPDPAAAVALAQAAVGSFVRLYEDLYHAAMAARLGLTPSEGTRALVADLREEMEASGADYHTTFRALTDQAAGRPASVRDPFTGSTAWNRRWSDAVNDSGLGPAVHRMEASNPVYVPRNHQVEKALSSAVEGDYGPFHRLVAVLKEPFTPRPGLEGYAEAPGPGDGADAYVTFCGT